MIQCSNFTADQSGEFGACSLSLYGGFPSIGTCRQCQYKNKTREDASVILLLEQSRRSGLENPPTNQPLRFGPGTELKKLLGEYGIDPGNCDCAAHANQMDEWGVTGCIEHREEIIGWLKAAAAERGWFEKLLSRKVVLGWLVDEAIRRAAHSPNE